MKPILSIIDLKKYFRTSQGSLRAVDGVSFTVETGGTLGLVGESGCGKSTIGKTIIRLIEPTSGSIIFKGQDILKLKRRDLRTLRRQMQFVFQDPYSSLNPRSTARRIIEEPLIVHRIKSPSERRQRVEWLMQKVGLSPSDSNKLPHEFSGGQRQRIGIARALALNPSFIICDEPVSALDVSIQAKILNLLSNLKREMGLSYLFISHDLSVVKFISDHVMVMYLGKIVEIADRLSLCSQPLHPYTQLLMSAVPITNPKLRKASDSNLFEGEVPSPLNIPSGCSFYARCPRAVKQCSEVEISLRQISKNRFVACHLVSS